MNPRLAENIFAIESHEEDPRLFVVRSSRLQVLDGLTGMLIKESTSSGSFISLQFLPPTEAEAFSSPPGDFSRLTLESNGTLDPSDDFFVRRMKDGTRHFFGLDGLMTQSADRNGNTFTFLYGDPNGDGKAEELNTILTPVDTTYAFLYSGSRVSSILDPAGRVTRLGHNGAGDLIQITHADGTSLTFSYDSRHLLTSQTTERSFTTFYEYDASFGWLKAVRLPDGFTRAYVPASSAALIGPMTSQPAPAVPSDQVLTRATDARGSSRTLSFDRLRQPLETTDALGATTRFERDSNGLATRIINRLGFALAFTRDARGNVTGRRRRLR